MKMIVHRLLLLLWGNTVFASNMFANGAGAGEDDPYDTIASSPVSFNKDREFILQAVDQPSFKILFKEVALKDTDFHPYFHSSQRNRGRHVCLSQQLGLVHFHLWSTQLCQVADYADAERRIARGPSGLERALHVETRKQI